ncbi:MAG: hypothetical protein EAZ97_07545 [Bacteroidetes bacterium]|nr:MAG: hypothetical protein EAZ97_07545 [Bacteroidota bacterium]
MFTLSLGFFSGYANEETMSEQTTVSASVDGLWKKIAAFLSSQIKENKENKKGKEKKPLHLLPYLAATHLKYTFEDARHIGVPTQAKFIRFLEVKSRFPVAITILFHCLKIPF